MASRNINQIYNLLRFIVKKQRGQYITITEAMDNLDSGQLDAFGKYFEVYAIDQTVHDALDQFRVYQPFTSAADGSVAYNDDYLHLLAGAFTVTGSTVNKIRFVQTDEWPDAITSQLRPVTLLKPIALDTSTGFQLYPQSLQIGAYNYMRRPLAPILAVTQVGRTITYDPVNSVQLEWLDVYVNFIMAKTLKYFGINMDEDKIVEFSQLMEKETQ
jgi:hypothetical protein